MISEVEEIKEEIEKFRQNMNSVDGLMSLIRGMSTDLVQQMHDCKDLTQLMQGQNKLMNEKVGLLIEQQLNMIKKLKYLSVTTVGLLIIGLAIFIIQFFL